MAITVQWAMNLTVTETIGTNTGSLSSASQAASLIHDAYNESGTLTSASSVPVTKHAQFLLTLSAGAATINLASLTSTNGALVDGTGLKMQFIRIKNLGSNNMTFAEGASNGYAIGSSIVVPAGGVAQFFFNEGLPDIASGDRTIDVSGTLVETAEISIVMG